MLFEPIPNLYNISKTTLAAYADRCLFENVAVGEVAGSLQLFLPHDQNLGWITAVESKSKSNRSAIVGLVATTDIIQQHRPEFLKIDVEGYEPHILAPLAQLLSETYQPSMLVEIGWGVKNPNWEKSCQAFDLMQANGYKAYDPRDNMRVMPWDQLKSLNETRDILFSVRDSAV